MILLWIILGILLGVIGSVALVLGSALGWITRRGP